MKLNKNVISKTFNNKIIKSFYLLSAIIVLSSHDLYIKMETYFLQSNQEATLSLYNGTFEKSENTIALDRILDASIVAHNKKRAITSEQWKDHDSTITQISFNTGETGTYVVGVSTKARSFKQSATDFNMYLKHDGVLDMLDQRFKDGELDQDAIESYEKHVKAIYQVGDLKTNDWNTVLGYPLEFVPLSNPYEKYSDEKLDVKLLLEGKPLQNQLVYADHISTAHSHSHHEHGHDHKHENDHTHTNGQQLRTNSEGVITVNLSGDGIYYLRTIYMEKLSDNDTLTHQSKWSTLSFEVTHQHGVATHTHEHEEGIPTWIFVVSSFVIIGILFMFFRKKD